MIALEQNLQYFTIIIRGVYVVIVHLLAVVLFSNYFKSESIRWSVSLEL